MINNLPKAEFTTERTNIKQYDMHPLDARRLDQIFKVDLKEMGTESNLYTLAYLKRVMDGELQGKKIRFDGQLKLHKGKKPKGGDSDLKLLGVKNPKEMEDRKRLIAYQRMLADPKFFSQLKG